MHTVSVEDFTRQPQRLLDEVKRGELVLVTDGGESVLLALPLACGAATPGALIDLAAQLYDRQLMTLERAARIAGLSYSETIDEFGRRDIATIRQTPEELERELAAFGP